MGHELGAVANFSERYNVVKPTGEQQHVATATIERLTAERKFPTPIVAQVIP